VYKLNMATIRRVKVGKYTYWQIVESRRVNGKPRPVVLKHLGTAEQLLYKLNEGPLEQKIRSASHGAVYLLFKTAEELGLASTFCRYFSSQKRDGLMVGQSLLFAAIHRAVHPGSKRSFSWWARQTTLPEIGRFDPAKLTSQHFWDQMNTVTDEQLEAVEKEITAKMMDKGLISPKLLFYDLTNFYTYIDSNNGRSTIAQRGRNKQKRHDLRQFGLAQVVTKEFLIPVLAEVYEGNTTDSTMFIPFITRLREKLSELNINIEELTIVFDKGSNTKKNFAELDKLQIPYVASLTPTYHEDLLKIDVSRYRPVIIGEQELFCYRTKKQVWGKERTIVMYLSEKLRQGQLNGLKQALEKKYTELTKLKKKLNAPRARKKKREDIEAKIKNILKGERGDSLIRFSITEISEGHFDIDWEIDDANYRWVTENIFGKKILVTGRDNWADEDIIKACFGQSSIERVFKHFKNPYHHAVHPQFHWTDQKVKVHTFICLSALLLSQVLWKKAREAGYNFSIETMIDKLTEVRKVELVTLTGLKGKPAKETRLEDIEPGLLKLYQELDK
jgi:transposase